LRGGEERADPRQTETTLIASEKGRKPMTRRQIMTTAVGVSLLVAGAFTLSGCDGDGQPARGTISTGPKSGAKNPSSEEAKAKATTKGKLAGRGGL